MKEIIKVQNLVKRYGHINVVDDISFTVGAGEVFAFLGPNGAGKSTTIKMLTTLLRPTSGQIFFDGKNTPASSREVRRLFSIVFQDQSLDDELTAWENMEFHGVLYGIKPRKLRHERIEELLRFVELWDRKKSLVKEFSGGMKRRLEIARGLLHHPKLIFLDEPTLGLDPQTRNHIWNYLLELNKKDGTTIFFTTHYLEEAEKTADHIAVIDNGKIISSGTAQELMDNTKTATLEEAFLSLTGKNIRDEAPDAFARIRMRRNAHH